MGRVRYVDKEILCDYELKEEFLEKLSLRIEDVIPLRKVFILITDKGKKILKITDSKKERIEFINSSLSYIREEYKDVLTYYTQDDGQVIYKGEDKNYVLLDLIEGRETIFSNPIEVNLCTKGIANMHVASKGLEDSINKDLSKDNYGVYLPKFFKDSKEELIDIKKFVMKFRFKSEFDEIFISEVDLYINEIRKAEELIAMLDYNSLLKDYSKKVLCHNDLAHHNFIVDGDKVKIIDFDFAKIDTRGVDIANYALKVIKHNCYDMKKFRAIINSYSEISELDKQDIKLIYSIFNFPRDFHSVSTDYYYKRKRWDYDVFLGRLKDKMELEIYRREFLHKFIEEFKDYFH